MTNRFYNENLDPVPTTTIRSQAVEQQFQAVAEGFDEVQAEVDLLAPAASPTFTGVVDFTGATSVLLPSVALAEATMNKGATLQYVQNVLGAAGALVPSAVGQDGKVLTASGGVYGWALKFPAQSASTSRKFLRSAGAVGTEAWDHKLSTGAGYLAVAASMTITTEDRVIDITAATAGLTVTLPDATTLFNGETFHVSPAGANDTQGVFDATGALLLGNASSTPLVLVLTDNGTAAGTWKRAPTFGTLSALPSSRYIMGASTTLRATKTQMDALQLDSARALCACLDSSGIDLFVAAVSGSDVTAGSVVNVAVASPVWMKLFVVTGGYLLIVATTTTISAVGITLSGNAVSAGSLTTVATCAITIATSGIQLGYCDIAADVAGDKVLVGYRFSATENRVAVVQGIGTSVNVGGSTPSIGDSGLAGLATIDVVAVDTDKWLVLWNDETAVAIRMCVVTTSAVTPTVAAAVTVAAISASYGSLVAGIKVSATQVLVGCSIVTGFAAGTGSARLVNISGTTPSPQASVAVGGAAIDGKVAFTQVGAYFCALFGASTSGAGVLANLSVSGNVTTLEASVAVAGQSGAGAPPCTFDAYAALEAMSTSGFSVYQLGAGSIAAIASVADVISDGGNINPGLFSVLKMAGKVGLHLDSTSGAARVFRYGGF